MARFRPCVLSLVWAWVATCGCSGHVADSRAAMAGDGLEERAGRLIVAALAATTTEDAALIELRMAAAAGVPWARLALEDASAISIARETRTELIVLLATRGNEDAITALQQATARDSTTLAAHLSVIDDDAFQAELPEALRHASERVRRAALTRLRTSALTPQLTLEVEALARHDPATEVRAAAVDLLSVHRHLSIAMVQSLLDDRDVSIRALAMRDLARLDCSRAQALLTVHLSAAPSHESLAAVRALSPCGAPMLAATLDALRRALLAPDNALRAEAAVTADSFVWLRVPDWLTGVIEHDPTPSVVLALAVALRQEQPTVAYAALRKLAGAQHPVVSVQAAALLAETNDPDALRILLATRSHADPATRRAAFRALAQHGDVENLEPGLRDADVSVRLAAAGSILRASL